MRMNHPKPICFYPAKQRGVILIVALVILSVITVVGIASIQSASMEMKMVSSTLDRNRAFAAAEAALSAAEDEVRDEFVNENTLYSDTCEDEQCFNPSCSNGLCFYGRYTSDMKKNQCETFVTSPTVTARPTPWRDPLIWSTTGNHKTVAVNLPSPNQSPVSVPVKYIVEFMCFVRDSKATPFGGADALAEAAAEIVGTIDPDVVQQNGRAYFQITVFLDLSDSDAGSGLAPVMLQSNYVYQI